MAYTTFENIQPYIQDAIDGFSAPTDIDVTALIEEYEAEVNSWLTKYGMTTPLTDLENVKFLRGKINQGVACSVWGMYVQDTQDRPNVLRWCEMWEQFRQQLIDGEFALPNPGEGNTGEGDGFTPGYSFPKITRE